MNTIKTSPRTLDLSTYHARQLGLYQASPSLWRCLGNSAKAPSPRLTAVQTMASQGPVLD
jgi:hypothetical protein